MLRSLRELFDAPEFKGGWPLWRRCSLLAGVCRALAAAHGRGELHRALTPERIFLDEAGRISVAGFGVVTPGMMGRRPLLGAPGYLAPELLQGNPSEFSARSDLFAAGAILYEAICGRRAFPGETPMASVLSTLDGRPIPPRAVNPRCPPELEGLCLALLSPRPELRPASAAEVAAALDAIIKVERSLHA